MTRVDGAERVTVKSIDPAAVSLTELPPLMETVGNGGSAPMDTEPVPLVMVPRTGFDRTTVKLSAVSWKLSATMGMEMVAVD